MMDVLRFIFSSFWIWLGFTTLVAVVLSYLVDIIRVIYSTNLETDKQTAKTENTSSGDCDVTEGRLKPHD